ncbi:MAG: DUF2946 family protein [Rhodocyclaceae bacterium]|nr:DUF2946 family protein [Rhodocyclaceae bacterium]
MDEAVLAAMARWPNVPEVFGWLGLDRRGRWRLRGEPIDHPGLRDFIARNYAHDERGRYFFQNGPQRVFVTLDYTPWVLRLQGETLLTQCGTPFAEAAQVLIDENGSVLLAGAGRQVGLIDDRDLPELLACLHDPAGQPPGDDAFEDVDRAQLTCSLGRRAWPVRAIRSSELAARFGFIAQPAD